MKSRAWILGLLMLGCPLAVSNAYAFSTVAVGGTNADGSPQLTDPESAPKPDQANRFSSGNSQNSGSFSYGVQMQSGNGLNNFNQYQQAPLMDDKSFFSHVPRP